MRPARAGGRLGSPGLAVSLDTRADFQQALKLHRAGDPHAATRTPRGQEFRCRRGPSTVRCRNASNHGWLIDRGGNACLF
jgi:hypothetical protein